MMEKNKPVYNASLSSMWAMKNFTKFGDFFTAAARLGFARVELNHQVSPELLNGIDLKHQPISSIHEPCPAVISANELKKQDLLISSPVEERRREGVKSIKRSIDLAGELRCQAVVIHCGQIQGDTSYESRLRSLFEAGQFGFPDYLDQKKKFTESRASLAGPHLLAVKKSLAELLEYAGRYHLRLGIENRFHYFDIPTFDEIDEILELAEPDQLGFIYDIGHAQFQDRLGLNPHQSWLEKFGKRIIGVHIHDVKGLQDHLSPGLGEVDFQKIAAYLPAEAFRTLEIMPSNAPEQIDQGMKLLVDTGCVNLL